VNIKVKEMSSFLDNLKKAVETGEFNSDAAKKINEISELASNITKSEKELEESLNERLLNSGIKTVTEEEVKTFNSEHDEKMSAIRKQDAINLEIKTLIEVEEMVALTIGDMFEHLKSVKERNSLDDPANSDLAKKIEEIELKYKSFIN
jgi:hypothetical protein